MPRWRFSFPGQLSPAPLSGHPHFLKSLVHTPATPPTPHWSFLFPSQQVTEKIPGQKRSQLPVSVVTCTPSLGSHWEKFLHLVLNVSSQSSRLGSHHLIPISLLPWAPCRPPAAAPALPCPPPGPGEDVWVCRPHFPLLLAPQPPPPASTIHSALAVSTKGLQARRWTRPAFPQVSNDPPAAETSRPS